MKIVKRSIFFLMVLSNVCLLYSADQRFIYASVEDVDGTIEEIKCPSRKTEKDLIIHTTVKDLIMLFKKRHNLGNTIVNLKIGGDNTCLNKNRLLCDIELLEKFCIRAVYKVQRDDEKGTLVNDSNNRNDKKEAYVELGTVALPIERPNKKRSFFYAWPSQSVESVIHEYQYIYQIKNKIAFKLDGKVLHMEQRVRDIEIPEGSYIEAWYSMLKIQKKKVNAIRY
jgi:Ubiquitin-2 like Rad60 SUMO-like